MIPSSPKVEAAHSTTNEENVEYTYKRILFSLKNMEFWHMLQHGWNMWYQVEWAGHRMTDTMWSHLRDAPRLVKAIGSVEGWFPGPGNRGEREAGVTGYRVSLWEDERVLEMDGGRGCTVIWTDSQVAQWWRTCLPMQETQNLWVRSLGWEDPLQKEMATCSGIPAWRIPWTEEPGRPQPTGSQRVRCDSATRPATPCRWTVLLKNDLW